MTSLELIAKDPARLAADALVVGTAARAGAPVLASTDTLPAAVRAELERVLPLVQATGAADDVHRIPAPAGVAADVVVLTGLGDLAAGDAPSAEALRRAAGAATRTLTGAATAVLALPAASLEQAAAVAEGALLGAYVITTQHEPRKGAKAPEASAPLGAVVVATDLTAAALRGKEATAAVERAQILAAAVHGTRDLVNLSPNVLYPESFADKVKALARGSKVKITVLDDAALRSGGYGGLTGVGQGSPRGPRLVKMSYAPAKATHHLALVGKGITFDSGGLSIKPGAGMMTMKCDMAGAAAVAHAVLAVAALGLPVRVTGWLCLAENMPSGTAQRPSDVVTMRNGTSVEVLNTDAEGRLVMADGLAAAAEEKPDVLLDVATLTGAQMIALGNQVSAVMGDDDVRDAVVAAAGTAGERFWPMPLPAELRESMKSQVADLANIGDRFGGMLVAGLFLREFTGEVPWAHLDIAGPAFNEGAPRHYDPKGGTGVAVRTLVALAEQQA